MAIAKKSASPNNRVSPGTVAFMASVWDSTRITSLTMGQANNPEELDKSQLRARHWYQNNWLVRSILTLRHGFYDFGFKISALNKKDDARIEAWAAVHAGTIAAYRRDAWLEWLQMDAVVCVWRSGGRPIVFPVEKCRYSDAFGSEVLVIRHGLTSSAVDALDITPAEKQALKASSELTLKKVDNSVFNFEVLKRARVGDGLGYPGMKTLYTALAQNESMEIGDSLLAGVGRDVIVQHKLGHEIKSGAHAGSKIHFATDAKVKKAIDGLKGKTGVITIGTNFDHAVDFPRPDIKHFDGKKYDAVIKRIALWAMPLGQMVLERSLNPYLMPVFKMQALAEREVMAAHMQAVFGGLNPPAPFRVRWSNRCFTDARLFADLLKFGLTAGPLSQKTFITEAGYDVEDERTAKSEEGKLPDDVKHPAFDAAHGNQNKDRSTAGRKPGTADGG